MMRGFRILGSMQLTIAGIFLMFSGVLLSVRFPENQGWLIYFPLAVLSINLFAAIISKPRMRQQHALLAFHLCLLGVVLLILIGRLVHFKGRVELTEGQALETANLITVSRGPWYRQALTDIHLEQGPIRVFYAPRLYRQETESHLLLASNDGVDETVKIDDNHPLVTNGYRFYITSNKGYSAVLSWVDITGQKVLGAVNFPSFPALDWKQIQHWVTPAGDRLTLRLVIERQTEVENSWLLTNDIVAPRLEIVLSNQMKSILVPGDSIKLREGKLRFHQLKMWMGYHISYDPTLHLLFFVAIVGVLALFWHFHGRLTLASSTIQENLSVAGKN